MWEPEPDWHPLPGGTGTSTVGVWRAAIGDQPVVVKRLARPAAHDPAELSDPAHFAYWRREADVLATGIVGDTDGLRAPTGRGRGGPRGHHDHPGVGRGRRQQRAVRRDGAGPVRGQPGWPGRGSWPATSSATGWPRTSAAAAGPRWPGRRSPTSPTTSGGAGRRCSSGSRRCRRCRSTATPPRRTSPAASTTTSSPSTGRCSAWARSAATSGYYSLAAREEFEPLRRGLPDGTARRPRHRRRGARSAPGSRRSTPR